MPTYTETYLVSNIDGWFDQDVTYTQPRWVHWCASALFKLGMWLDKPIHIIDDHIRRPLHRLRCHNDCGTAYRPRLGTPPDVLVKSGFDQAYYEEFSTCIMMPWCVDIDFWHYRLNEYKRTNVVRGELVPRDDA